MILRTPLAKNNKNGVFEIQILLQILLHLHLLKFVGFWNDWKDFCFIDSRFEGLIYDLKVKNRYNKRKKQIHK